MEGRDHQGGEGALSRKGEAEIKHTNEATSIYLSQATIVCEEYDYSEDPQQT